MFFVRFCATGSSSHIRGCSLLLHLDELDRGSTACGGHMGTAVLSQLNAHMPHATGTPMYENPLPWLQPGRFECLHGVSILPQFAHMEIACW